MPTGPRLLVPNSCYHIMIRGNQKQKVFFDNRDHRKYLSLLRRYKIRFQYQLYGYCLMPNHIHLIGEPHANPDLARFMHDLNRAYTAYFNNRYGKVGHLWQGRFKSKVVIKDQYLLDCIHYIEHNPVRAEMVRSAGDYTWISHQERVLGRNIYNRLLDQVHL